jgi:hypothetical protein
MKAVRSISAVILAIMVLVSSTSFMIGMHICMGEVQDVALFTKADVCEMEKSLPPCHRHAKTPCCEDGSVIHKGEDFKASFSKIEITVPAAIDIVQPLLLISEIIPAAPTSRIKHYTYDPPWRSCDLIVEHQVFLI